MTPASSARPRGNHRAGAVTAAPWRAIVFAPVGDGQTRRRGSDALRLGAAVIVVLVCWLVTKANSNTEHAIATTLASPPDGIRWLVSTIWWVASVGIIALVAVLALVSRRWSAIRDIGLSGRGPWVVCLILTPLLGSTGGRPPDPSLHGFDLTFPVARVAATVGVATAALPYLSRWLQRSIEIAIGLPGRGRGGQRVGAAGGRPGQCGRWAGASTALVHLIVGSPLGLPSTAEVLAPARRSGHRGRGRRPVARPGVGRGPVHRAGRRQRRSTSRSTGVTPPTPNSWPRRPASSSIATRDRP